MRKVLHNFETVVRDKFHNVIHLDFSEAFAVVPHEGLIKMVESQGVGGEILKCIKAR